MNNCTFIGRLAKEPELKYSQSGKAFCRFTIAVQREFNKDEVDFLDCVAWNKTAETIAEYLRKGKKIAIHGRLETSSYERDDGTNIKTYTIIVDRFYFVESNNTNNGNSKNKNNNYDDPDYPF